MLQGAIASPRAWEMVGRHKLTRRCRQYYCAAAVRSSLITAVVTRASVVSLLLVQTISTVSLLWDASAAVNNRWLRAVSSGVAQPANFDGRLPAVISYRNAAHI